MRMQFLGTAAAEGVPALFCPCDACAYARAVGGREIRTRSGAMIDGMIKIDFPPDTYHHVLSFGLDLCGLSHLLVTHSHFDHLSVQELAFRRIPFAQLPADSPPLTVYGNEAVEALVQPYVSKHLEYRRIRPFETIVIDGYRVSALRAVHMETEETLFFLVEKDGRIVLYALDTDEFTDADMEFLQGRGIDLISQDCTNGRLDLDYIGHMGIRENLRMRERLLASGAATVETVFVCNHFSHNGVAPFSELEAMADGMLIAYDGMVLEV